MKRITFYYVHPTTRKLTPIEYGTGQAIGLYSSWSSLALTHHILIRFAARLCKIKDFKDYLVLGDDVLIAHHQVAERYKDLIISIGVRLSLTKRVLPGTYIDGAEFASRLVKGNFDISPLPVGLIAQKDVISNFNLATQTMERFLAAISQDIASEMSFT